ncbi:hypothetical protein [Polyangium mundeleinium]|uniref:Endonuclease/exonuclease/phosphatase domain-containing protein n=1 Tax=Polyangium mundeleinium TaxID=2995306 RepID=A0ABT5F7W5_9BACT|nr:hypothetical protein [Polyangium mundeleinium]MDC0749247.1 hypothetical protein [Polyangium mundeleinium]
MLDGIEPFTRPNPTMPNLNVITWNSTGETPQGAADLLDVINHLTTNGWLPDLIVIQEANAAPGGPIYQMLQGLGAAYNQPPAHATEGCPGGRGYILLLRIGIGGQGSFATADLANDQALLNWMNIHLSLAARQIALAELATMRMPAMATLTVGGRNVPFLTWHAPRGPGQVLTGATLGGGANPDAYLFLQNSGIYGPLVAPGPNNLGLIAGDLNVNVATLNHNTGIPALPYILPGFVGVSDNLDHILGHANAGGAPPTFSGSGHFPASGTHNILVSTVGF